MRIYNNFIPNINYFQHSPNKKQEKCFGVNFTSRAINNSNSGTLNEFARSKVQNIFKNLTELEELNTKLAQKYYPVKISSIKEKFKDYISKKGSGISFRFNDYAVTVNKLQRDEGNILKIYCKSESKEKDNKLFIIDGEEKVVANTYISNPSLLPPKFRYMTNEEIQSNDVITYLTFLNEKLNNYILHLKNSMADKVDGKLLPEYENALISINNLLDNIDLSFNRLENKYKNSSMKILRIRNSYPDYAKNVSTYGYSFKYGEDFLNVYKTKHKGKIYTKIILKDKDFSTKDCFIIEENKRVISNINKKHSGAFPPSIKYMTDEEIEKSGVKTIITATKNHLDSFDEYIKDEVEFAINNKGSKARKVSIDRPSEPAKMATEKSKKEVLKETPPVKNIQPSKSKGLLEVLKLSEIDDIIKQASGKSIQSIARIDEKTVAEQSAPLGLPKPQKPINKNLNKLMYIIYDKDNFLLKTLDDNDIYVTTLKAGDVICINVLKIEKNGKKSVYNFDFKNKRLLKTGLNREPLVVDGKIVPYSYKELQEFSIETRFNSVLDEIALALDAKIEPQEIEKKLKPSKEPEPTKALEPKLQLLQRDEHIITDNSNIEEVKAMAKSDAKEYAEVYFNTFIDELKKLFAEKLEDFRKNKNRFFD